MAERPESKTRKDVMQQELQESPSRWKRVGIDAALFVVVLFCVTELALRLLHR